MSSFDQVRVRIAPSPTGDPHVGLAYMTLFNYVFAKQNGGKLVLRIEDTDQTRAKASSEQLIGETLRWLGLEWDEGPDVGGEYGPYRQTLRKDIHLEHAELLLQKKHAYRCFCSQERLADLREQQRKEGKQTGYDGHCRNLTDEQIESQLSAGNPHVIRMKMPTEGVTVFEDAIRGQVEIENHRIDDQILIKSDGFPTYHLANVVDDHLMKISHVIRAEEWIASTPKHVVLYEMFGWQAPTFAHLPLLRNPDKSKISKRKSPVSLVYYKRKGILPQAMLNFLGLMGWSYGDDVEVFSVEQMIEKFKFKDIHLGGPVFDLKKLTWLNQKYLQQLSKDDFVTHIREEIFSEDYLSKLYPLLIERIETFDQFVDKADFFFNGALDYTNVDLIPKKKEKNEVRKMFKSLLEKLDELYEWETEKIQNLMNEHREEIDWKPRDYFMPVRLVVSGRKDSPPLPEMMEVLGREMVRFRIRDLLASPVLK